MGYIDIEDALQSMLTAEHYNACAKPLPASYEMPHIVVDLLNAADDNLAQAIYNVDFDIRCADYATAAEMQCEVADWARRLEGRDIGGKPCHRVESLRMQRIAPDAANQEAILATVSVGLRVRIAD